MLLWLFCERLFDGVVSVLGVFDVSLSMYSSYNFRCNMRSSISSAWVGV